MRRPLPELDGETPAAEPLLVAARCCRWSWNERDGLQWGPALRPLLGLDPETPTPSLHAWLGWFADHGRTALAALVVNGEPETQVVVDLRPLHGVGAARILECWARVSVADGARRVDGVLRDVSHERQMARRLEQVEQLANVGSFRYEIGTGESWWSDQLYALLGCDPGAVRADPAQFLRRVCDEDRPRMTALIEDAMLRGIVAESEFRLRLADGRLRSCKGNARIEYDAEGRPLAVMGVIIDVSARVEDRTSLRESRAELEAVQDLAAVGTWCWRRDGDELEWCARMRRLHAVPDDVAMTPELAYSLVHPDDREDVRNRIAGVLRGAAPEPFSYRVLRLDGSMRHVIGSMRGFGDAQGIERVLGTVTDVTERVELQTMLLHAQKLEGIGRLAGGIAHDFNNILTAIISTADAALGDEELSPGVAEDLREIIAEASRAASLARQMLVFARRDQSRPELTVPTDVVDETLRMVRRLVGENVHLRVVHTGAEGKVLMGGGHLQQILVNLIVNARDALPNGGSVVVTTRTVELDVHQARPFDVEPGPYVRIDVEDDGVGMDGYVVSRVFEPFFTTKEPGSGTGLGLSTCYGLVRQAGGHIELSSKLGQGTAVSVFLPVTDGDAAPESVRAELPRRHGGETILLAEDEPAVRRVMVRTLTSLGYRVVQAADGQEALSLFKHQPDFFDLLVTDVVMPRLGGVELHAAARRERGELRVLFTTGYAGRPGSTDDTPLDGPLLRKPFTPDALAAKVREVLDGTTRRSTLAPAAVSRFEALADAGRTI